MNISAFITKIRRRTGELLLNNLIAWYQLESGDGTIVADSSGNGNDATEYGGFTYGTTDGRACSILDGSNGRATISAIPGVNNAVFTVSMWFLQTAVGGSSKNLFGIDNHASNYGFLFYCYNNRVDLVMGPAWSGYSSASFISANTWHHFALVVTASNVLMYADGVLSSTTALVTAPIYSGSSVNLTIGADYDTNIGGSYRDFFNGSIYDVRIYDRALSGSEITILATP